MTGGKFSAGLLVLIIRSLVFNLLFYLNLLVQVIAALPTLLMPRWGIIAVATFWARTNLWLLRVICGIRPSSAAWEKFRRGRCWYPPSTNRCGRRLRCC